MFPGMSSVFYCQVLAAQSLLSDNQWELHPFLPARETVFQSSESIVRAGLLYMPLVRSRDNGLYEWITGKRCFEFLQTSCPQSEIQCRVLPEDVPNIQLLNLLYAEHTLGRELTAIELAHFLQLCRRHLTEQEQQQLYTLLGISEKPYFSNRLLELLSLETPLQAGLQAGLLPENIGRELLRLDKEDRLALYSLFLQLNIGGGKQKRILSLLRDLAGRRGISVREVLAQKELQAVLNHAEMNIPQKTQVLLQLLQHQHAPSLADAESRFSSWQNGLSLPDNCTVTHSQAFEQDQVTLSVTFANTQELETCWKKLQPLLPGR